MDFANHFQMSIGQQNGGDKEWFEGDIGAFFHWNYVFSKAQINEFIRSLW